MKNKLLKRLPAIAKFILHSYREEVGTANSKWLEDQIRNNGWEQPDLIRFAEIMPKELRWMLHDGGDE